MKSATAFLIALAILAGTMQSSADDTAEKTPSPRIEIAFVLDTTGSMGGLIAGAKEKIWSIANQIASGKPRPDVFMALVPYRDKQDDYVTKVFQLTSNLDQVYTDLMGFAASGGGDTPENVNQGLYDAIHKLQWSQDDKVVKIIFLVGDCPPHNEYTDVPQYDKLAKAAVAKGIYINTILCGNNSQAMAIWREIAKMAEGDFIQIAQDGAVRTIDTPFDAELAELNRKLVATAIVYGDAKTRERQLELNESAAPAVTEPGSAAGRRELRKQAARADFSGKSGKAASNDLVSDIERGKTKLEEVDRKKLPENMQKMTPDERKAYIAEKQKTRKELNKQIEEVAAKRNEYLKKEMAKSDKSLSPCFDGKVIESLERQAGKKGIDYSKE